MESGTDRSRGREEPVAHGRELTLPSWRATWLWSGSLFWFLAAVFLSGALVHGSGVADSGWWAPALAFLSVGALFSLLSARKMGRNKVILRGGALTLVDRGTWHRVKVADVVSVQWTSASPALMNSWSPQAQDARLTVTTNDGLVIEMDLRIPSLTERVRGRKTLEAALASAVKTN